MLFAAFFSVSAFAEDTFNTREQLESALRTRRPSKIEFTCSADLYAELGNNGFRELLRTLVRSGFDPFEADISYNSSYHRIELSGLVYTGLPWAECKNLADVSSALKNITKGTADFILLCPDGMVEQFISGSKLRIYAAEAGISNYAASYSAPIGFFQMKKIEFFSVPGARAEDYAQFSAAVSYFASKNIHDFYIAFSPEFFTAIREDQGNMTVMIGSSLLSNYASVTDPNNCTIHFSDTKYTYSPREICRSVADVADAIRRMGALGHSAFDLIFPDTAVFDILAANDFAELYKIRTQAGMIRGDFSYSYARDQISFSNAKIVSDVVPLTTLAEAIAYTEEKANSGEKEIHLFCTADLYRSLNSSSLGNSADSEHMERIYDLADHAGIADYTVITSETTNLINIRINKLYPGKSILLAARGGNSSGLSTRERQTWQTAEAIAEASRDTDPLQTAKNIHDWICANVTYMIDDFSDEDDNAIGAILNGKANCDGYADAFYLIGGLAGLNIRYQHGDSASRTNLPDEEDSLHLWNLIEIGGVWRMVDVTWDDNENGWSHTWFNFGRDLAERTYIWNKDMTVSIAADTPRTFDSGSDFYVRNREELRTAVNTAASRGLKWFYICFGGSDPDALADEAKQTVLDRIPAGTTMYYFPYDDVTHAMGFYDMHW